MTARQAFNILAVVFLVIGLVIGLGIGSFVFPQTVTNTVYHTETSLLTKTVFVLPQTITSVHEISTVLTTVATKSSILLEDEEIGKVEGGGILAWGWGLGKLEKGDIIKLNFSSTEKVLVCLDLRPEEEHGWKVFSGYYECVESAMDDEGSYKWVIEQPGFYALIIGKQAGYLSASFKASIIVLRTKSITTTTTIKTSTTEVFITTSYSERL